MQSFALLGLSLLVGTVACLPTSGAPNAILPTPIERRDNCTVYSSPSAGTVCLHRPSDCTATYMVQPDDTCQTIGAIYNNFTLSEFYYWNPDIGQTCFGLQAFTPVCINTPWYKFTPPVQSPDGTVVPASSVPVPVMPSIVSSCSEFELAGGGYRVDTIVAQNNITMDQFLSWNQAIQKDDPVAWAGYWVCVKA